MTAPAEDALRRPQHWTRAPSLRHGPRCRRAVKACACQYKQTFLFRAICSTLHFGNSFRDAVLVAPTRIPSALRAHPPWSKYGLVLLRLYALERPAQLELITLNFSPEVLCDTSLAVNKAVSAISASPSFLSLPLGVMSVALSSFLGSAHHNAYSSSGAGCRCSLSRSLISQQFMRAGCMWIVLHQT
jgi:hypothetical protein